MKPWTLLICVTFFLMSCHPANDSVEKNTNKISEKAAKQDSPDCIKAWNKFCDYLSVCDTAGAKSILSFPLKTRGILDSDPYINYTEKEYMTVINLFFKQQIDAIPCDRSFAEKLKKYQASNLYPNCDDTTARIGDAVFEKVNGKWKINFLYVDTAEGARVYH